MLRCGKIEPGTAAMDSSSRRKSAVRMLVSWRQPQRSIPTVPSVGSVGSWRSGRIPLRTRSAPSEPFAGCEVVGSVSVLISDRHPKAVDETPLDPDDDVLPHSGQHEQADRHEEQPTDVLQGPA